MFTIVHLHLVLSPLPIIITCLALVLVAIADGATDDRAGHGGGRDRGRVAHGLHRFAWRTDSS